jgi:hypothetical protein
VAGVGSRLPALSLARTKKSCSPSVRPVYVIPDSQVEKEAWSSKAHSKVASGWSEVKANVASVLSVGSVGPESIVVSGNGSTVHRKVAGDESTLPAVSFARTRSSCSPTAKSVNSTGEVQEPNDGPSRAHSNTASGSFEEKTNVALVFTVDAAGPDTIAVSGGRSTVHS